MHKPWSYRGDFTVLSQQKCFGHPDETTHVNLAKNMSQDKRIAGMGNVVICLYFSLEQLLATCCSAALHRRHLMVWKIFAPRFVFEGVSFLLTTVVLVINFLAVLRVDQALRSWFKKLEASVDWKTKNR